MVGNPAYGKQDGASARPAPRDWMTVGRPLAVAAFIRAVNDGDLDALVHTFVDDALVNDQLLDHWGKASIAAWAERDIITMRLRFEVVNAIQHHGHWIVTAHLDGLFDKRGLPDPLVVCLYVAAHDDKIVQLIILRNQSGL
jgi:hypothetical protein